MADDVAIALIAGGWERGDESSSLAAHVSDEAAAAATLHHLQILIRKVASKRDESEEKCIAGAILGALRSCRVGATQPRPLAAFADADIASRLFLWLQKEEYLLGALLRLACSMKPPKLTKLNGPLYVASLFAWNWLAYALYDSNNDSGLIRAFAAWAEHAIGFPRAAKELAGSDMFKKPCRSLLRCIDGSLASPDDVPAACRMLELACEQMEETIVCDAIASTFTGADLWFRRARCSVQPPATAASCLTAAKACVCAAGAIASKRHEKGLEARQVVPGLIDALAAVLAAGIARCSTPPSAATRRHRDGGISADDCDEGGELVSCAQCEASAAAAAASDAGSAAVRCSRSQLGTPLHSAASELGECIASSLYEVVCGCTDEQPFSEQAHRCGAELPLAVLLVRGDDAAALAACKTLVTQFVSDDQPFVALTAKEPLRSAIVDRLIQLMCRPHTTMKEAESVCRLLEKLMMIFPEQRARIAAHNGSSMSASGAGAAVATSDPATASTVGAAALSDCAAVRLLRAADSILQPLTAIARERCSSPCLTRGADGSWIKRCSGTILFTGFRIAGAAAQAAIAVREASGFDGCAASQPGSRRRAPSARQLAERIFACTVQLLDLNTRWEEGTYDDESAAAAAGLWCALFDSGEPLPLRLRVGAAVGGVDGDAIDGDDGNDDEDDDDDDDEDDEDEDEHEDEEEDEDDSDGTDLQQAAATGRASVGSGFGSGNARDILQHLLTAGNVLRGRVECYRREAMERQDIDSDEEDETARAVSATRPSAAVANVALAAAAIRGVVSLLACNEGEDICRGGATGAYADASARSLFEQVATQLLWHTEAAWSAPQAVERALRGLILLVRRYGFDFIRPAFSKQELLDSLHSTAERLQRTRSRDSEVHDLIFELLAHVLHDRTATMNATVDPPAEALDLRKWQVRLLFVYSPGQQSGKASSCVLGAIAAVASFDAAFAKRASSPALLSHLLRLVGEMTAGGMHERVPTMRLLPGVAAIMKAAGEQAAAAIPHAVPAAHAIAEMVRTAAAVVLTWGAPTAGDNSSASLCPRVCVDAVLLMARLLAAAKAAADAASSLSATSETAGAAAALHSAAGQLPGVGAKRPRPPDEGSGPGCTAPAAADVGDELSTALAPGVDAEALSSTRAGKRQLVSMHEELPSYSSRASGVGAGAGAAYATPANAPGNPSAAYNGTSASAAVFWALAGSFDALAALYLQFARWFYTDESDVAVRRFFHRYASAGGNALSVGVIMPALMTMEQQLAALQSMRLLVEFMEHQAADSSAAAGAGWSGAAPPSHVPVATPAVASESQTTLALQRAFVSIARADRTPSSTAVTEQRAAAGALDALCARSDASVGNTGGCSSGVDVGSPVRSQAELTRRAIAQLTTAVASLRLPSGASAADTCCGAGRALLSPSSAASAAAIRVATVCGMACVAVETIVQGSAAARDAALACGVAFLILRIAELVPAPLLHYPAHAACTLLVGGASTLSADARAPDLLGAPFIADASASPSDAAGPRTSTMAAQALRLVATRLSLSDSDGSAFSEPCITAAVRAATAAARGLEACSRRRLPAAAEALADGCAVSSLLLIAGHATCACLLAGIDGGAMSAVHSHAALRYHEVAAAVVSQQRFAAEVLQTSRLVDQALSLAASAWPLLTAEGKARVDAALDSDRIMATMMRHASSEAALRFHVALCCDAADPTASAARLKRAVTRWSLMAVIPPALSDAPRTAVPSAGDLAFTVISEPLMSEGSTAAVQTSAAHGKGSQSSLALQLLHAALVPQAEEASHALREASLALDEPEVDAACGSASATEALASASGSALAARTDDEVDIAPSPAAGRSRARQFLSAPAFALRLLRQSRTFCLWAHRAACLLAARLPRWPAHSATRDALAGVLDAERIPGSWTGPPFFGDSDSDGNAEAWCIKGAAPGLEDEWRAGKAKATPKAGGAATAAATSAQLPGSSGSAAGLSLPAACMAAYADVDAVADAGPAAAAAAECPELVDPLAWYTGLWRVMHDDERDDEVLLRADRDCPNSIGAAQLVRFVCSAIHRTSGPSRPGGAGAGDSYEAGRLDATGGSCSQAAADMDRAAAVLLVLLRQGERFWGSTSCGPDSRSEVDVAVAEAAATLLAHRHRPEVVQLLLPVLTSAARMRAPGGEFDSAAPPVLQSDAASVCTAVLAHHGSGNLPVVRLVADFFVALIEMHGATSSASIPGISLTTHLAAAALQTGSPMVYLVNAARANLRDAPLTLSVAKLVRWLGSLPTDLAHAGAAELAHAGAVRWLAEALFSAEDDFEPSHSEDGAGRSAGAAPGAGAGSGFGSASSSSAGAGAADSSSGGSAAEQQLALVKQLVEAAQAVAGGRLHADVVETGLAGSLMRLVRLLDGRSLSNPSSSGIACSARLALASLLAGSPNKRVSAAATAAQAVRLAVAARENTWRRRRHVVVARAVDG